MNRVLLASTCLLLAVDGLSQCADTANIYQFEYGQKTYEVVMEKKSWDDAAACSNERGGYLVEIENQNEQDAVFDAILNGAGVSPTYVEISNGGGIAYVWIGATDKGEEEEGIWLWDGNDDGNGIHFWSGQGGNGDNDGTPVEEAYVLWGGSSMGVINEPDNYGVSGQDNAAIGLTGWPAGTSILGSAGEWNDIIGSSEIYFVIEYDSVSTGDHPINANTSGLSDYHVYPNPTNGLIHLRGDDIERIEIYDLAGKRTGSFQQSPLDLSHFNRGTYIIKIYNSRGIHQEKIILE